MVPARAAAAIAKARQRHREVHPGQERAGVDPGVGTIGVAGRRLAHVERHSEVAESGCERETAGRFGSGRSHGADDELERCFDLRPVRFGREEVRRGDDRPHDFANVAVGVVEPLCGAIDSDLRRRVGDEPAGELGRDEAGG